MLMSRLREGRANTARGTAHFLRETVSRVRYAGAQGQLTVRADSGFYTGLPTNLNFHAGGTSDAWGTPDGKASDRGTNW